VIEGNCYNSCRVQSWNVQGNVASSIMDPDVTDSPKTVSVSGHSSDPRVTWDYSRRKKYFPLQATIFPACDRASLTKRSILKVEVSPEIAACMSGR
jgi:hypothetical protein